MVMESDLTLRKECIEINKSLFTLRKVISALSSNQRFGRKSYIPYRESKLTSILKESIGGNSYCLMIATINPSDKCIEENISTLNYSTKTTYITNMPIRNQDTKSKVIVELKVSIYRNIGRD